MKPIDSEWIFVAYVMAEPRRIGLISVDGPPQQKKVRKTKVTRRFELSLVDTTNEECPEFSYVELLKNDSVSGDF